jgi:excisionase family DNA binding protein
MSAYASLVPETMECSGCDQQPMRVGPAGLTRDEVLTAREVAELLKMPVSTIYELARRGDLPARRFGRTWRFLRPRLEELLSG